MELKRIEIRYNSKTRQGLLTSYSDVSQLKEKYKIIAEPIGTPITSRKQNKILTSPFVITLYDIIYLYTKEAISINEASINQFEKEYKELKNTVKYKVFKDLKEKNHYIISGFKYGCDFLAYKDDPNFIHSDYLICCFNKEARIMLNTIILNERISVTNRKKLLLAFGSNNDDNINYMGLSWMQL